MEVKGFFVLVLCILKTEMKSLENGIWGDSIGNKAEGRRNFDVCCSWWMVSSPAWLLGAELALWIISAGSGYAHLWAMIYLIWPRMWGTISSFDFTTNFYSGHDQDIQSRILEIDEDNGCHNNEHNFFKHSKTPLNNLSNFLVFLPVFHTFSMQKLVFSFAFSWSGIFIFASEALCSVCSETDCSYLFSPGCHTLDDLHALSFFLGKTSLFAQSVLQGFFGGCCITLLAVIAPTEVVYDSYAFFTGI